MTKRNATPRNNKQQSMAMFDHKNTVEHLAKKLIETVVGYTAVDVVGAVAVLLQHVSEGEIEIEENE